MRRRAARAGGVLKRPPLRDGVRDLYSRPWNESKRRARPRLARAQNRGSPAAVAGRILASHNRTIPRLFASVQRQRQCCSRAPQIRNRNERAALLQTRKLLHPILHGPAQVDTMRQTVLALAICGASALQPARNARRQSLAVRQAPRGVRQRVFDGESRRHRRNNMKRRAATPTARRARRSTRRPRSRTPTIRSTRC